MLRVFLCVSVRDNLLSVLAPSAMMDIMVEPVPSNDRDDWGDLCVPLHMKNLSIITVSYNSEKSIAKTIETVLCQSFDGYEYIVVDGNSKDETLNIIKKYEPRFNGNMKWVSEPDLGIYDAMNKGINLACGDWLIFINCGDLFFDDNSLRNLFLFINSNDIKEGLIYGDVSVINEKGALLRTIKYPGKINKTFLIENMLCHQSTVYSKSIFKKMGLYDLRYKICADYDMLLKIYFNGVGLVHYNAILSKYLSGGISENRSQLCGHERRQIFKAWAFKSKSLIFLTNYTISLITNYLVQIRELISKCGKILLRQCIP